MIDLKGLYLDITVEYLGDCINIFTDFVLKPWHRAEVDEDIQAEYGDIVLNNFAGWLWFVVVWKSVPSGK